MKIVLLGIQGSGKGTQAKLISEKYGIPHISVGDIFKGIIAKGGKLGEMVASYVNEGNLVPNDLTAKVVSARLKEDDCKKGYILDGYPRNMGQAKTFFKTNNPDHVLFFHLDEDIVLGRILNRKVCPKCGEIYSTSAHSNKNCLKCNTPLIVRSDEHDINSIKKRIEIYKNETLPLLSLFEKKGILRLLDLNKTANMHFDESVKFVFTEIQEILGDVND